MEYCCHVWACAPNSFVDMSDKLQKRECSAVDPSLAASLEPLARLRNVTSLFLTDITLGDITGITLDITLTDITLSESQLVPLLYSC